MSTIEKKVDEMKEEAKVMFDAINEGIVLAEERLAWETKFEAYQQKYKKLVDYISADVLKKEKAKRKSTKA